MTDREQANAKSTKSLAHSEPAENEDLPYRVMIWPEEAAAAGKVLARAASVVLARAIYKAALEENPGRHVTLNKGSQVINDSREV
jgi:hypothetical protein